MLNNYGRRAALTLVELLVVIAVISVLIALLLPAVQSAREAARRATCKNHLRQIATAWHTHMNAQGHFPTGGWPGFTGDPERGFHKKQPGEWTYNILPFIEQQSLHELGANDGVAAYLDAAAYVQRTETPIPTYYCPSRRPGLVRTLSDQYLAHFNESPPANVSKDTLGVVATLGRLSFVDYATNSGDSSSFGGLDGGPAVWSYEEGDAPGRAWVNRYYGGGVCYIRSEIRTSDIEDGLTYTYLLGEKHVDVQYYLGPINALSGDMELLADFRDLYGPAFGGFDGAKRHVGTQRFGIVLPHEPQPDSIKNEFGATLFGSAHDSSFHMAFCDASVRAISYDIDPNLHVRLGLRDDGLPADPEMHGPLPPVRRE
jgi:hypothetical protein